MTNLTVIILTGKEELHIRRCLEKLAPLEPRQIIVVESQKGDRTHEKAIETAQQLQLQAKVQGQEKIDIQISNSNSLLQLIWHDWPGLYAKQFNWALDYVEKTGEGSASGPAECSSWILRLDADEYLTPDTIEKLKVELPRMRWRLRGARFISNPPKRPTIACRATSVRSFTSPSATSSKAAFSMATAAGCGTSGKGCGTGVWSIGRLVD